MSYLSLAHRVPEKSAVEPRALVWLYALINRVPLVRTIQRRFVQGVLAQGASQGCGLDLGTGPGDAAIEIALQRPGLRMVGLDLAGHMVERAGRRSARVGLDGRVSWSRADGHTLPFADHSFDLVISSFSMHHWADPPRVLDEIGRVLRPGGQYYIADICRDANVLQRLIAYGSIPAISLAFGSYRGFGGYYESVRGAYTRAEARTLLEQSGLPPGEVGGDSTWFVPVLTLSSRRVGVEPGARPAGGKGGCPEEEQS